MAADYHIGQRLSLKSQTCTVRYIGPVDGKQGDWLGVEWDDTTRGKHNGSHEGKKYFDCRSISSTSASFLRPNQPWDATTTFLEALRQKYMSNLSEAENETIMISKSKQAEEVGFDKFARRQAELRGIRTLVLDRMCIRHSPDELDTEAIEQLCAEITDLDISGNLFESFFEIWELVKHFPKLRTLTLDGNRFSTADSSFNVPVGGLNNIRTLNLSNCLLDWSTEFVPLLMRCFPLLDNLTATDNESTKADIGPLPVSKKLDLSGNTFASLADINCSGHNPTSTLILKKCGIYSVGLQPQGSTLHSITELDIRHNAINDWTFFNELTSTFPSLKHLRTTGNPLYNDLKAPDGKPLAAEDGYMLTLARLPKLEYLNYSKITEKERLNAETYYLNSIAAEISAAATEKDADQVIKIHPRWKELCEEYGEPAITRKQGAVDGEVDPNSLAARLVKIRFSIGEKSWVEEVPRSFTVHELLGLVGKNLRIMPLKLRLVYESNEQDLASRVQDDYDGPEWWCSDEENDGGAENGLVGGGKRLWITREFELVPGTRMLGSYIEGREAKIRVERKG